MQELGPPPAYSEAISCSSAIISAFPPPPPSTASASSPSPSSTNDQQQIWTIPVPSPDLGQMIPPPSYAESLRSNPSSSSVATGRCGRCHTCRRLRRGGQTGTAAATEGVAHQQRSGGIIPTIDWPLPRPQRHQQTRPTRNSNSSSRRIQVFPAERPPTARSQQQQQQRGRWPSSSVTSSSIRDVESLTSSPETGVRCADRFRDIFLTILMRVMLIFLFIVFLRILISQMAPEES